MKGSERSSAVTFFLGDGHVGIVVACRCGQAFEADAWLAGKVVQCPACRSPIAVPTPVVETGPVYIPRQRPAVSAESNETAASIVTFVAAALVIFVVVLGLSLGLVWYLKGTHPLASSKVPEPQERRVNETPAVTQPPPAVARPVPSASIPSGPAPTAISPAAKSPSAANPVQRTPPRGNLPSGWNFYDHPTGGFSAAFPTSPTILERMIQATAGDSTMFLLTLTQNGHVYEASREIRSYRIPAGGEEAAYESLLRVRAREMEEGMIEGSKNATVDGRLVCDAILRGTEESKPVRKYLRIIVSGDTIFQLACTVPPGSESSDSIKIFLGNYQLP